MHIREDGKSHAEVKAMNEARKATEEAEGKKAVKKKLTLDKDEEEEAEARKVAEVT